MKTYPITLSKVFPAKHQQHGNPTNFRQLYEDGEKIHTIRANCELWENRFENILAGEAVLSLRQWSDKPYYSKQELIKDLTASDMIGVQRLIFLDGDISKPRIVLPPNLFQPNEILLPVSMNTLAKNDGLFLADWLDWFRSYDLTKPMAIIHFTKFRYANETNS